VPYTAHFLAASPESLAALTAWGKVAPDPVFHYLPFRVKSSE